MYHYQQFHTYFGQTAGGMEPLAATELTQLGATEVKPQKRGVLFSADTATLYKIVYHSRLLSRVLATITTFNCHDTDYLYTRAGQVDWSPFIREGQTFAILHTAAGSKIQHSQFAALRLKDAIVDQLRERYGQRPSIDRESPDVWLQLAVHNDRATINIDCAGHSLSKRGYRVGRVEAPMQETLAAAIIMHSKWDGQSPLCDPFCGSGTLLAEAVMSYCRIPASYLHSRFGFMQLPDYDAALWQRVKADVHIRPLPRGLILGSDIDPRAIEAARANLAKLPHGDAVSLKVMDFRKLPPQPGVTIVANPPYGVRLKRDNLEQLYRDFGGYLRRCPGSTSYVYSADVELLKCINLRPRWSKPLNNGGLDGTLYKMLVFTAKKEA